MKIYLATLAVIALLAALYFAQYAVWMTTPAAANMLGVDAVFGSMICFICAGGAALIFSRLIDKLTQQDGKS